MKKDSPKPGSDGQMGWWYELMPLTYDRWRIILTDGQFVDDGW